MLDRKKVMFVTILKDNKRPFKEFAVEVFVIEKVTDQILFPDEIDEGFSSGAIN